MARWGDGKRDGDVELQMPDGRTVYADTHRLFVLGMTKYPPIIDVTQMEPSTAVILEQLLLAGNGNAHRMRISMNQTAELCHVATHLQFKNLLKLVEKSLLAEHNPSMKEAVDALAVAVHFEMKEAADKFVDDIVFGGFEDEELLMYCKSEKALEMIIDRKSALLAEQQPIEAPPTLPDTHLEVAVPRQAPPLFAGRFMMSAAKQKIRGMLEKPMSSLRNGIVWISNRRRRQVF